MSIPKDPFSVSTLMGELDRELFNHIRSDMVNGTAFQMDDETLDMLLTGIWEWGPEEVMDVEGIVVGVS
ncbi:hypothetical protein HOE22_08880 [Candidatus Woesearchaeota archaeon]|jgi:hypothetical protein|nr:hypothetical protein [Candidatus Woesearchaeota archaeon]MBT7557424.1 hypothetical protein [Candidatus Woesearchaeota archaeon]